MVKYLSALLLIISLIGCKQKTTSIAQTDSVKIVNAITSTPKKELKYNDPLFVRYAKFLDSLDKTTPTSCTSGANKYKELFAGRDREFCDTAFTIFNEFYKKTEESLEDINEKDSLDIDKYYGYVNGPKDIPVNILAYVKSLKQNGFDIVEEEGTMYVGQDRDFVAKHFYNYVSDTMKEFLQQVNKENKNIYMEDGSVIIDAKNLIDRTVWWETFEKKYPNFIWIDEATATEKEYLYVLLKGSDNTEIMYGDSNQLNKYFKEAYEYLGKIYPGSAANDLVAPFYSLALKGDRKKAEQLVEQYEKTGVFKK